MINEDKKCKQYKKNLSVKVEVFSCSGLNYFFHPSLVTYYFALINCDLDQSIIIS